MSTDSSTSSVGVSRTLGAWKIIFLIVAAMTPLSVVVGTLPLGLAFGGPSAVWMYVIAGAIIGVFVVGYVQMVKRISRPGAFYSYISRGLGKSVGVASAMLAAVGYTVGLIGSFAINGFITRDSFLALGIDLPWQAWLFILLAIVAGMVWFRIDFSSTVLGVIVVAEVVMVLWLVVAVVSNYGFTTALPADVWSFDVFNTGSWAVAFIFAILCYQGFEAGALYAPEAKKPEKSVPRGLYGALVIITVLYALAGWALVGAAGGVDQVMTVVFEQGLAGFVFATAAATMGPVGVTLLSIATIFAQLAILVAITNFMSRYIASISRERILPKFLSKKNRYGAPSTAIFVLLSLGLIFPLVSAAAGIDPYAVLSSSAFALGAIVSTGLLAITSAAVFVYFRRVDPEGRHWWKTTLAPLIAFIALLTALVVELQGFDVVAGPAIPWASAVLPPAALIIFILGLVYASIMRKSRPDVYAKLAEGDSAEDAYAIFDD